MQSAWHHLKKEALRLRNEGFSIRKIELRLGIPRSTLSGWFKGVILSESHKRALESDWERALIHARSKAVIRHNEMKRSRIKAAQADAAKTLSRLDLSNPDIAELALAMLYLGEGFKSNLTGMGNSDPMALRFFVRLLQARFGLGVNDFSCALHLRADQDGEKMKTYWSSELGLPLECFRGVFFDGRTKGRPTREGYKGVCLVKCGNIAIQRKLVYLSRTYCTRIIEGTM